MFYSWPHPFEDRVAKACGVGKCAGTPLPAHRLKPVWSRANQETDLFIAPVPPEPKGF